MSYPAVSSNTLFHFTPKREYLLNILQNNFRPRYCLEDFRCLKPETHSFAYAFPMTCFCDLPLSRTNKHLDIYGRYGIGLTKEWGNRSGLNPVLYVQKDSFLWKDIDEGSLAIQREVLNDTAFSDDILLAVTTLKFFIKPYEGDFTRSDGTIHKDVRFYDEREWRFVPKPDKKFENYFIEPETFRRQGEKSNQSLPKSATLKFTPDDIRYIIVDKENEILGMIDKILELKGQRYTYDQVRKLTTRIISADQIREDF